jgi:hypothetical protein
MRKAVSTLMTLCLVLGTIIPVAHLASPSTVSGPARISATGLGEALLMLADRSEDDARHALVPSDERLHPPSVDEVSRTRIAAAERNQHRTEASQVPAS